VRSAGIEKPLHSHLVCRACGATVDVTVVAGADPRPAPSDAAGFVVDEAAVTFWGLCPDCRA
jgi:Fur family ferric uptake transcriptional regulator